MKLLQVFSFVLVSCTGAFVPPTRKSAAVSTLYSTTTTKEQPVEELKHEIEDLRAEALRRMQALKTELSEVEATNVESLQNIVEPDNAVSSTLESNEPADFCPKVAVSNARPPQQQEHVIQDETSLLDGTRWKVMLNIGREPGTWMPKTWGVSGERLLMNVEVEFKSDTLYQREEFLNGMANAKKLEVHHVDLGPTLSEDVRHVKFKNTGGWRVAPGEGPMGTAVLRFYIEIEEDVRHQGGDVYCPKGRVYCTCGYFPMHKTSGIQDRLREEQAKLTRKYDDLSREMESAGLIDKIKVGKEMLDVRMEANKVGDKLNEARVREPEKSLLRLSRKGDVGLTKEGGVCCKVDKGLAIEYHILGKFGVASIEKREEIHGNLKP